MELIEISDHAFAVSDCKEILLALKILKKRTDRRWWLMPTHGICSSTEKILFDNGRSSSLKVMKLVRCVSMLWPKFSGYPYYPVPSASDATAESAYVTTIRMWRGKYGANRRELLSFIIEYLELRLSSVDIHHE